jgi:ribonuclease VapC
MVLDSSAVVSVILEEDGSRRLAEAMANADNLAIGAPTLVETDIVMMRRLDLHGRALVAQFLEQKDVVVVPFDESHWKVAAQAFIRYGKGRHPAALNYGDCMTYATAHVAERPLLFAGDDFAQTDLVSALG